MFVQFHPATSKTVMLLFVSDFSINFIFENVDLTFLVVRWTDGSDKNLWNGQHSLSRSGKNLKNKSETEKKVLKCHLENEKRCFLTLTILIFLQPNCDRSIGRSRFWQTPKKGKKQRKIILKKQKKTVNFLRRIKICQIAEFSRNRKRRLNMSIKSFSVEFFV